MNGVLENASMPNDSKAVAAHTSTAISDDSGDLRAQPVEQTTERCDIRLVGDHDRDDAHVSRGIAVQDSGVGDGQPPDGR